MVIYENNYLKISKDNYDSIDFVRLDDKKDRLISIAIRGESKKNKFSGRLKRLIDGIAAASKKGDKELVQYLSACAELDDQVEDVFDVYNHSWEEVAAEHDQDYMCQVGNYIVLFKE